MTDAKTILKKVRKLEISTRMPVDGLVAGSYHSIFKGQGIEFSEIREYSPGDDVRSIDWKVTARMNKPYIKEYIEERDLRVYFAVDVSGSGDFGSTVSKFDQALEIIATLLMSAAKNNDNCGLFLLTDDVEVHIPARKGKRHALRILSKLIGYRPQSSRTNLALCLQNIYRVMKRRSVLFIISDFMDDGYDQQLKLLSAKHDVVLINMVDKRELEIPDIGLIELEDEETGEQVLVDTSDPDFRKEYKMKMSNRIDTIHRDFKKNKIDSITLNTDESYLSPLRSFFKRRKR